MFSGGGYIIAGAAEAINQSLTGTFVKAVGKRAIDGDKDMFDSRGCAERLEVVRRQSSILVG